MFETTVIEQAMKIVEKDPFLEHDVVDKKWVKEWIQE